MTIRESLDQVLSTMPDDRLVQVLDFAEYLALKTDLQSIQEFGRQQFARAYDDTEPEYTLADVKSEE